MNVHELRRYHMLERVVRFGEAHGGLFAGVGLADQMFTAVAAAVRAADAHRRSESVARSVARTSVLGKARARKTLRDKLAAIRFTASVLDVDTPGVSAPFRLRREPRDRDLVYAVCVFLVNAERIAGTLVAHALPATFLADLSSAVDEFTDATRLGVEATRAHIAMRKNIEAAVAGGVAAVRHLDAIAANHLRDNPAALAEWRIARRIERSPARDAAAAAPVAAVRRLVRQSAA